MLAYLLGCGSQSYLFSRRSRDKVIKGGHIVRTGAALTLRKTERDSLTEAERRSPENHSCFNGRVGAETGAMHRRTAIAAVWDVGRDDPGIRRKTDHTSGNDFGG